MKKIFVVGGGPAGMMAVSILKLNLQRFSNYNGIF
ncbi:hypothetical protein TheetDRAFT_1883 [Thermoanaerobacter ethanolicus JW 200]|nr:hypothetical protein TheetDRAFT_1883 [Thermoanaerobacter ethanolicus JW 200]